MSTTTLRSLARKYAIGNIDRQQYRQSRGQLIRSIINGNTRVEPINFLPPLELNDEYEIETIQRDRTEIIPMEKRKKTKPLPVIEDQTVVTQKLPSPGLIAGGTLLVMMLVIAVVVFYPKPPGSNTASPSNATVDNNTVQTADNAKLAKAGEQLIAEFLDNKNWNEQSMQSFIDSWNELSMNERATAANTKRMQRLGSTIYKQFLEARALASIDANQAIAKQTQLIKFANTLGIVDSRMVLD